MPSPDGWSGRDPAYLRDVQYRDPAKLTARADLHARYSTAAVRWPAWVMAQIEWPSGADVLEVGCGPGWLWAEGSAHLPPLRLTLTDLSPGMVAAAADRVGSVDVIELVEAREADAQSLPFDDDTFDVVVANHMLYHVPDPDRAVAEMARVLRPDGVLVAATNGPRHLRQIWEVRSEVFGGPPISATVDVFGSVTGATILGRRFDDIQWLPYPDTLRCTVPEDVVAFITSSPPGETASPAQRLELEQIVERRWAAGGGVFVVSKESGVFLARGPHR